MNAVLAKFNDIQIDNIQQIAPDDKTFCEMEESSYRAAVGLYLKFYEEILKLKSEQSQNEYRRQAAWYISEYIDEFSRNASLSEIKERIKYIHSSFIANICRYFSNGYSIKIDSENMAKYLGYLEPLKNFKEIISYKTIVNKIVLDLGGHTFSEKAVAEIKGNAFKAAYNSYNEKPIFVLKKSKIIFEHLTYSSNSWGEYQISLDKEPYKAILRALTHFDSEGKHTSIYDGWLTNFVAYNKYERNNIYNTHETKGEKVTHFKYYKNGKWEIIFQDQRTMLEFARQYLGYRS